MKLTSIPNWICQLQFIFKIREPFKLYMKIVKWNKLKLNLNQVNKSGHFSRIIDCRKWKRRNQHLFIKLSLISSNINFKDLSEIDVNKQIRSIRQDVLRKKLFLIYDLFFMQPWILMSRKSDYPLESILWTHNWVFDLLSDIIKLISRHSKSMLIMSFYELPHLFDNLFARRIFQRLN